MRPMIVRTAFRRFCASGRFLTDGGERLEVPVNLHHTLWGFGGLFKLVLELHSLQYEAVRLAHVKHIQRCYKQCTLNLPEEAPPSPKNRRGRLEELSEFLLGTETGMQSAPHETRISRDLPRSPPWGKHQQPLFGSSLVRQLSESAKKRRISGFLFPELLV